jgi:DNA phosphorothioation system restriction enzyme
MAMQNKIDSSLSTIDWEQLAQDYTKSWQAQRVTEKKVFYQTSPTGYPKIPATISIRDYQQTAILSWFRNRGRGTLKMATGSGKTITALAITTELYQKIGLQALLVICPYQHLVQQWAQECERFNLRPILAMMSVYNWQNQLSNELYNLSSSHQSFLTVITTNSTFITEGFQSQLKFFPEKTLIIGDEAHNLGTPRLEECLSRKIGLRLALSATPERYFDEEGTDAVFNYFGDILQPEFTLADAIAKGALVPYCYYPIFVELTELEALNYAKLTQRIGWALQKNAHLGGNDTLTALLMQRSRLVGAAENKLDALRTLMQERRETHHTLFYCGDGSVAVTPYRRQLEAVTYLLGRELGYRVNTYTAQTPLEEREQLKQQFVSGELQGLVAIRCLDEGVDIPSIQTAIILASSGNPRQFIQRRGRVLRPYPGKTQAHLFDMIVLPPELDRETWEVERNLLRKELKRFVEFAQLAMNADEATQHLLDLQENYCL